jgi:hypothetical protein
VLTLLHYSGAKKRDIARSFLLNSKVINIKINIIKEWKMFGAMERSKNNHDI